MLVDAVVVVIENLITHLAHVEKAERLPRLHVIYRATQEVAGPVIIQLEKLPSITLEQSVAMDGQVQKNLRKNIPEIDTIVSRGGSDELGLDPMV